MAINKNIYLSFLNCPKQAYLKVRSPELGAAPSKGDVMVMRQGSEIGKLARTLFDGRLIETPSTEMDRAASETQEAIVEGVECLFEGAFTNGDVSVRADILQREEVGWHLIEVKSSKSVKPEHVLDVAFQVWALGECGLEVARASVMTLSPEFRSGQETSALFVTTDVTEEAKAHAAKVPEGVVRLLNVLAADASPPVVPNRHCFNPDCVFLDVCYRELPDDDATTMPRLTALKITALHELGKRDVRDIPEEMLSARQRLIQGVVCSGAVHVEPGLAEALAEIARPIQFVDFESDSPAIPTVLGVPAYQQVPFQWSMHVLDATGEVSHSEFLHRSSEDPRPEFVRSLAESLLENGTVMYYSRFEVTMLKSLAAQGVEGAEAVLAIFEERGRDLMKIVEGFVYHPGFMGQTSIKRVLPSLVPNLGYDDLGIQDGSSAAAEYRRMLSEGTVQHEKEEIAGSLLRYCERDTLAMLKIFEALVSLG